jgi:hypothetical protein
MFQRVVVVYSESPEKSARALASAIDLAGILNAGSILRVH